MPIKIALLGLDQITGSIGLALRERAKMRLVGFDRDFGVARAAQNRGLIAQSHANVLDATEAADLVLLGGPLADQPEWLAAFAPTLREGAVVASLSPLLGPPLRWAAQHLSGERYFVAAHPLLNPALLYTGETSLEAAHKDLFADGLWALADAPNCAPEALKLLSDLATLLGAQAYFVDATEHDGLIGGTDALPALLALALMRAAHPSPGWHEMRKVADRGFATATFALSNSDPEALMLNRENVLRYLDAAMTELQTLRASIADEKKAVIEAALTEANERRARWQAERARGEWEEAHQPKMDVPTFGEALGRMLTGGLFRGKKDS
jgi:prephenate dehydrogenase